MSIKSTTTIKASSLLTVLCLSAALTITSCGGKDTATTTTTTTTESATTPATGAATTPATATTPLSAADKAKLTPAKTALVMANTAIKSGDVAKAKAQFAKFNTAWPTVEPIVKAKAGANYPAIASGIETVKTAMSAAKPDTAKAGEGLNAAIKGMNEVLK
jgi:iron uptake system EfeUOB component EfeO/EfeM